MAVEPVPNAPAGVVETGVERLLVVADYHAGIETVLRTEGVELDSRADQRGSRVAGLLAETEPDRLVVLGDLVHAIGDPWEAERSELEGLFDSLQVPVTVVKGNHDGEVEGFLERVDHDVSVTPTDGIRIGTVGFAHGHTWPGREVLESDIVCVGHEHPLVRLEDDVGGSQVERVWLRGQLGSAAFENYYDDEIEVDGELVVCPAFNDLSGGTQVNIEDQRFLSPFLPEGLVDGEAYLLDGTRLGDYKRV